VTTPFLGEIQLFAFNFAPLDWALCNGATVPISQYSTLFSLLGTNYGGNGQSNFQLPNLVDRAACSQGQGQGLSSRTIGETFGEMGVTLTTAQMPQHNHTFTIYGQRTPSSRTNVPKAGNGLTTPDLVGPFIANTAPNTTFAPNMLAPSGGNQPHENRQPFLAINFCIALQGAFPSFS
jgi:microcystin-dependent protein